MKRFRWRRDGGDWLLYRGREYMTIVMWQARGLWKFGQRKWKSSLKAKAAALLWAERQKEE